MLRFFALCLTFFAAFCVASQVDAQRPRFTQSTVVPGGQVAPPLIGNAPPQNVVSPQSVVTPQNNVPTPQPTMPTTVYQQPVFDPFANQPPTLTTPPQSLQPPGYIYSAPPCNDCGVPNVYVPNPNNTLFGPTGSNGSWAQSATAWPSQQWSRLRSSGVYRLLERPRFRHTYLGLESEDRNISLNETELATTLSFPNFLFSGQPVRVSPGFIFHFWDGPVTSETGADLPSRTYSTYLASDFTTPWTRMIGAEVNFTVGVYSDFSSTNTNSLRLTGVGLGWFRINHSTTFKLGVEYLDRVRVKLLPAGGFFIYPRPDLKVDLYFPRPKIAWRLQNSLQNIGVCEMWGYIGGEYGGGSWTIERIGGLGDQVDYNDIRVFTGFEWLGARNVTGFFEVGYVFDRELVYRSNAANIIGITDTYMLRTGVAF